MYPNLALHVIASVLSLMFRDFFRIGSAAAFQAKGLGFLLRSTSRKAPFVINNWL